MRSFRSHERQQDEQPVECKRGNQAGDWDTMAWTYFLKQDITLQLSFQPLIPELEVDPHAYIMGSPWIIAITLLKNWKYHSHSRLLLRPTL
jgi:hypothetical protein